MDGEKTEGMDWNLGYCHCSDSDWAHPDWDLGTIKEDGHTRMNKDRMATQLYLRALMQAKGFTNSEIAEALK